MDELLERIACRFGRIERRRRVRGFLLGLLADLPRKNCWTLAEHAGDATPDGMQHLLARAVWDPDGECARTCATTSWTPWAIAARCW